ARRREHRSVRRDAAGHAGAHAVHPHHAQPEDDGDRRPSLRGDDGGARCVETDLGAAQLGGDRPPPRTAVGAGRRQRTPPMNESKATRYQRRRRRAQAVTWTLTASALAVVALTPLGSWLHGRLSDLVAGAPPPVQSPLTFVLFVVSATLICGLAALPALRYHQFAVDPADGRAGEGLRGWAAGVLVAVPAAL